MNAKSISETSYATKSGGHYCAHPNKRADWLTISGFGDSDLDAIIDTGVPVIDLDSRPVNAYFNICDDYPVCMDNNTRDLFILEVARAGYAILRNPLAYRFPGEEPHQTNMFTESNADLPLMSGTAPSVKESVYDPKETAYQPKLF